VSSEWLADWAIAPCLALVAAREEWTPQVRVVAYLTPGTGFADVELLTAEVDPGVLVASVVEPMLAARFSCLADVVAAAVAAPMLDPDDGGLWLAFASVEEKAWAMLGEMTESIAVAERVRCPVAFRQAVPVVLAAVAPGY